MSPVQHRMVQVGLSIVASAVILFCSAGRLAWGWAWAYLGISVAVIAVNGPILLSRDRDLVAERGAGYEREGAKTWDKWLGGVASLLSSFASILVAGLDLRYGWTPAPGIGVHLAAAAAFLAGYALASWAMLVNPFFSTVVRIQKERGHTVADRGPYTVVRHPGYVGFIVSSLATPLLLGSVWALIPAALATCLMIARTALEDRMLRNELPGYAEYAAKVRFKLVPGVW